MDKEEKEFTAEGWKSNKILSKLIEDASSPKEIAEYIQSPAFTEKDYVDVMSGMYKDLSPYDRWGHGSQKEVHNALSKSPHNKLKINDKVVDFLYDVLDYKRDWNKAHPNNTVDLRDHIDNINNALKTNEITSKKIHQLVSDPKYMLEDRYSSNVEPPNAVLKNNKIKPEHLYKYLASHPSHINELVSHDKADSHLEDLIFDNPEHLKNVTNSNIDHYLNKHIVSKEGQEPRLDISGKRAKTIVEHAHDKLYNRELFITLNSMDPEDKKSFIDRKLGITGGKPAGLASWRTNDEQANRESEGWADWINGDEYDAKFATRIANSPHLTDGQAEHIKHHGDFDTKYNLYHNKHIDPKHGVEMFKMWHDNDENKGYNAEQLQEKYQKNKDDIYSIGDIDPNLIDEDDLIDQVDEVTREAYPFENWVDRNKGKLIRDVELDDKHIDDLNDDLLSNYDWTEENPNHNKELHKLHSLIYDNTEHNYIHKDKISELTGKDVTNLGISHLVDGDGEINGSDLEEHMNTENPKEIDYSSSDDYTIYEHPDYEDRYNEIADDYKRKQIQNDPYSLYDNHYEDYTESTDYQEAYQEAMDEAKKEAVKEHFDELYTTSHQDDRFIPEHLHQHIPNFEELKRNRKKAIGEPTDFLNKQIPNRLYEHPYGEEQHLHEFLKDYADANGGSIDIGRMHKLMPNQGEVWKKIFGGKGKISSNEIQGKIDQLQKTPYAISYGKWDGNKMQNVNYRDQIIFRLDHTDESLKPLKEDPELFRTFNKVQEVSKRSGHPTKDNSIAWARVDATDPDHWMIDEVQSDFGKTVTQYLKENNEQTKAQHVQKISDYHKNWREALINHVLKEAKKHNVSKVSTHSPESKASHTGAGKAHTVYQDSYKKVPRKMGFKPAPAQTLPLTEETREKVFNKQDTNPKELMKNHTYAWNHHKSWANAYLETAQKLRDPATGDHKQASIAEDLMNLHTNLAEQHGIRAKVYGQTHDNVSIFPIVPSGTDMLEQAASHMAQGTHEKHAADEALKTPPVDFSKQDYHEGHTYNVKPNLIKNMLDIVDDLVKFELIAFNTSNVEVKKKARVNIVLIQRMLGIEPDLRKWENRRRIFTNDLTKNEDSDTLTLHHSQILASHKGVDRATLSNKAGRGSKTKGPLHVHKLEDGRHLLVDGYHRFARGLSRGKKHFKVKVVSHGYTDYHATPHHSDEFKGFKKSESDLQKAEPIKPSNHNEQIRQKIFKTEQFQISISLPNEESRLDKSAYHYPTYEGEKHPTKDYIGKKHPEGKLMWHYGNETAQKHDRIINDPKLRQNFLQKMPTTMHKRGMEALMNVVAKDPRRHFIPSRDGGRERMRARHIKTLLLSPESAKIDLDTNNKLSITMGRHGEEGGSTTWDYNLTSPKKVVKNENNEFKRNEQGRDSRVDERIFSGRDLRQHGGGEGSVKKTQHRADLSNSRGRNIRNRVSGKHLQKLDLLMKGAMRKLAPFKPEYGSEEHKTTEKWTNFGGDSAASSRDKVPAMPKNAKIRALHKLGKHTEVRKHPKTGERMFLLHRGMDGEEYNANHSYSDRRMNHSVYDKGTKTSWTPHIDTAFDFAKDHKALSPTHIGKVVSAWIPESEIHSIPNQILVPNINDQFRNEHEIIVNHKTPHPHANKTLVDKKRFPHKDLQTKISMKGHAEKERKSIQNPEEIRHDQVAREKRAMKYREKKSVGKREIEMKTLTKADLTNKIKAGVTGLAIAANIAAPLISSEKQAPRETTPITQQVKTPINHKPEKINTEKNHILGAIKDVESSNGKNVDHPRTPQSSLHRGEKAYGSYALMGLIIRETIKKHPDLLQKYGAVTKMQGSDLHNFMDKNPTLENEIASRHYDRLAKVFGHDPEKISMAWLNGIVGTKTALKNKEDISKHWHVTKVKNAYERLKKQPPK